MTATPTASSELPDVARLLDRAERIADWFANASMRHSAADVRSLIALARRAQPEGEDGHTVDHRELAGKILSFSGISSRGLLEPGADPLAGRLAEKLAGWGVKFGKPEGEAPQADGLTRYSMWSNPAGHGMDPSPSGDWVSFDEVRVLLAAQSQGAPATKYECNPRHENGSLMGWKLLDVDSDAEAAERMGHGALGEWRLAAQPAAAPDTEELLQYFVRSAYKVDTTINRRGHNWSEAYLDQALAAYHASRTATSAPGTPEAPADIDYSISKGDTVYHKMWRLTSLEVVDVNWALRAIAVRLGPTGGVVVWPAACLSKTPYDDSAAQLDGGQGGGNG